MTRFPSRRETLSLFGIASVAGVVPALPSLVGDLRSGHAADEAPSRAAAPADMSGGALGQAAARAGVKFGAAIDLSAIEDEAYGALYAREARIVTTENAFKFAVLRRTADPNVLDFAGADALVGFAARYAIPMRAHTLIWNDNLPSWVTALPARDVERLFDSHIEAVVSRYAGRVFAYDVVNEPLFPWPGAGPDGYRRGAWFDALGPSYIARAFKRVAAIDRRAKLVLNEAFTERDDAIGRWMRPRLLRLIDDLLDQGVPLAAIGLQGHVDPQYGFAADAYAEMLHEIARRGLDIQITELDVNDASFPADIAARDAAVARRYAEFAACVLREGAVSALITWGLSDRQSWYRRLALARNPRLARLPRPLLFDEALGRKPAYGALKAAFEARRA